MPELPEVERAARALRGAIIGAVVDRVQLLHPSLRRRVSPRTLRALRGATVRAVERRGKHQLIHLDDGRVIHVHFRLNGDWHIGQASKALPRFARAALLFADGTRVVLEDSRALSTLDVHRAGKSPELRLGPEPDDPALTAASLRSALSRRHIPIKVALLDQRVIAGIARATGARYSGDAAGRFEVYDRRGRPCRRCRTPILRLVQSGRSTYFCPRCQGRNQRPRAKSLGTISPPLRRPRP